MLANLAIGTLACRSAAFPEHNCANLARHLGFRRAFSLEHMFVTEVLQRPRLRGRARPEVDAEVPMWSAHQCLFCGGWLFSIRAVVAGERSTFAARADRELRHEAVFELVSQYLRIRRGRAGRQMRHALWTAGNGATAEISDAAHGVVVHERLRLFACLSGVV